MTIDRVDPPTTSDEQTSLVAWLDFHRDTLLLKADGLDQQQLAQRLEPSALTLGGLLKHMALVESSWLSRRLLGRPMIEPFESFDWSTDRDWEFHSAADDTPEELKALFAASRAASDEIIRAALADGGLDTRSALPSRDGGHFDLRWILTHLVEEYARHNGHADLIRESIDGATGE
ncbi:DinB family protein [Nocardioides guangzhouensis]|uniref:DinB family protein n=1 Tax=Nocardioides guangzhouensis TaxID=2497878 RepID=A0A4Q4ZJ14_9ACTN|nr:DinB family protein [Nocardioides guangzhouensis]RYP88233.1 DinB family protein [Nocardioides guangzhouensis]